MTSSASRSARRPHRSRLGTTVWRGSGLDSRRRRLQLQPMTARSRYEALGQPEPIICVPAMDTASISRRGRTDLISRLTVLSVRQDRAARLGNNLPQRGDVLRERDAPGRRQPSRCRHRPASRVARGRYGPRRLPLAGWARRGQHALPVPSLRPAATREVGKARRGCPGPGRRRRSRAMQSCTASRSAAESRTCR
jgi:hypothetical protein